MDRTNAIADPIPTPDMEPGRVYCLECDVDRRFPRIGPDHVAIKFMSEDERNRTDIYLHGERVLHAYEVLNGHWAIVSADDRHNACPNCMQNPLVRLDIGPYEVRRIE